MSKLKQLTPFVGHINTRARQAFADVPKMEKMLKKSGLQDFYRQSDNLTIVDAYSGYGYFGTALYNSLQPKKMFLMDPSQYSQEPLEGLQAQDPEAIKFLNTDPFQWKSFYPVYESIHKEHPKTNPNEVSRDVLFVANLAYAKGQSLLYQYLLCVVHQNWLQRYGRVRMLVWSSALGAEKLTHGLQRPDKIKNKDVELAKMNDKIEKYTRSLGKATETLEGKKKLTPAVRAATEKKKFRYERFLAKLEQDRYASPSFGSNKRYKSTLIRELTCDYRYLIGGDVQLKKDQPSAPSPYDKKAVEYFKEDYMGHFVPRKVSSLGGLVLLELTPKKVKMERMEEWFFVVTRLFVSSTLPIQHSLDSLGPGAYEWMSPHLPETTLRGTISELSLDEIDHLVEVFWRWPFKPSVLIETYEERVGTTAADSSVFENPLFDDFGEGEEEEGGVEEDDII
ncbi:Mitochondrial transcription factor 1 [Yarrowia sp. B02]|nr:Mitochondrial transcription factor 1 [Yarrowia sp. B02]